MTATAFLGLGAIGRPMARRLAAAFPDTVVWNRTAATAAAFGREHGVRVASSAAEAGAGADVVVTCLPTSQDVAQLLEEGLGEALRQGAVLVDCTSGDPATSRRLATTLARRGVAFMDAPVSGGTAGAENGTLTVMCGGDPAVLERVRPVLASFGSKIVHCGEVGAGDALKAVNNALLALHVLSTAEGLAALARSGVRPEVALDVINASSGRSNASMNLFPDRVLTRAFPRTFRLALLDKDTRIAAEFARAQRVPAPLLQMASELMLLALKELGHDADHVEAVRMVERLAEVEIR